MSLNRLGTWIGRAFKRAQWAAPLLAVAAVVVLIAAGQAPWGLIVLGGVLAWIGIAGIIRQTRIDDHRHALLDAYAAREIARTARRRRVMRAATHAQRDITRSTFVRRGNRSHASMWEAS